MANYNISTTVAQERALTFAVARFNSATGSSVTNAQFLTVAVDHMLNARIADLRNTRREGLEQKYEDATPAVKAQVNAALDYSE